jgi:uncharacterized protein YkwD
MAVSRQKLNKKLLCVFALTALSACGGGSDASSPTAQSPQTTTIAASVSTTPNSPDVSQTPVIVNKLSFTPLDAGIQACVAPDSQIQFSSDTGFTYSEAIQEQAFLEMINYLRCLGIGPGNSVARSSQIDSAADQHAAYSLANNSVTHTEIPNSPGYVGLNPGARIGTTGYPILANKNEPYAWGEVLAKTGSLAQESFDGLTAAIYHRFVMLSPQFTTAGIGLRRNPVNNEMISVVDFAATSSVNTNSLVVYPADGQKNVPIAFNSDYETPDPAPDASFIGYPISLQTDRGTALNIGSLELSKKATGEVVDAYVKGFGNAQADGNLETHQAFVAAKKPLDFDTEYQVKMTGTVTGNSATNQVQIKVWTFRTVAKQALAVAETNALVINKYARVKLAGCDSKYTYNYTSGLEVSIVSAGWMQIKGLSKGAQWVEVSDNCGQQQRVNLSVQ